MHSMESALDWHSARAALEWQFEMGIAEALCETPVDRFAVEVAAQEARASAAKANAKARSATVSSVAREPDVDPVDAARIAAQGATSLDELKAALAGFEHCELKRGARSLVFADGADKARVMFVGEAPGRDEDVQGKPFVGRAGQLLDKMLAAIGQSREESAYITNVLPWRPPQNRDPKPDEIAMMVPFLEKHIGLIDPDVVVIVGNISCQALLGRRGISRLRGQWTQALGRPALPMFHPAYLLRNPGAKREAWADLLSLKAKLRDTQ